MRQDSKLVRNFVKDGLRSMREKGEARKGKIKSNQSRFTVFWLRIRIDLVGCIRMGGGGKNDPQIQKTMKKFNVLKFWMFYFEGCRVLL